MIVALMVYHVLSFMFILAQASLVQARSTLESSNRPYRHIRNMLSCCRLMVVWLAYVLASADDEACALQKALGKSKMLPILSCNGCNSMKRAIQSLRDSRMKACSLAAIIWTSGQAVMDQKKWHTISMLA